MANKKKPGRDAFEKERTNLLEGGTLPTGYGTLLRTRRPDLELQHIYHVKAGKALDWDVLEELKKLAKENAAHRPQPVAA
jgi:hypothetical protein